MKKAIITLAILVTGGSQLSAQNAAPVTGTATPKHLYIDVHSFGPGKVKYEDVAAAHKKDLAAQGKYGVNFIKYWVDEKNGLVYCLSSASDSAAVKHTHADAHGLIPGVVYEVTAGEETAGIKPENLFFDIHYLGEGKVTADAVSEAHKKDLAAEGKNNVKFINYWVDEKRGVVMCLSQANNEKAVVKTHSEAHGLIPDSINPVKEGQ